MKRTNSLQKFIDIYVDKYCKYLGLYEKPIILYKAVEVANIPETIIFNKKWYRLRVSKSVYRYFGYAYRTLNVVFLNIKMHKNRSGLRDTIAHELIHMRYKTGHSSWFNAKVKEVIRNA